jgi:LPS-assembly lipoprotein
LAIRLGGSRTAVVTTEARPEFESVALDANYTLTDIATKKPVLNASATARATLSVPGAQQRFARSRGQLDAERRAAQVIADQIRARLASYFMAGT